MAYKKFNNSDNGGRSAEDRALDKFAELLIAKLETIKSDWKKPWFTEGVSTSLPKNLSGREYNGMNSMMLMLHAEVEGYKLPVWATFDRITSLNYVKDKQGARQEAKDSEGNKLPLVSVNKGATSFPVFLTTFTCVHSETKEHIPYDDYKNLSEDERAKYNVYPKLHVYNVFNVEGQTNLKEARPEFFKKLQEQNEPVRPAQHEGEMFSFPAIDHMIAENKWICPIKPKYGDNAYYSISANEIVIPEKRQFKDGESFYSNLAHEMAHSTGAENQLNRLKPTSFGSKEYAQEELVAEMSAALVSQRYGMSKTVKEDSLPYLKSWLDTLKEEPSFIKTVLLDVKRASGMINQHIDKIQMELDMDGREEPLMEKASASVVASPAMNGIAEKSPTSVQKQMADFRDAAGLPIEKSLANVVELSPLMQQYNDFKRSRPSFTPLFHVSGGYETYQGDAERVGKILNLPVQESATHLGPDGKAAKYIIFPDRDFEQYKQVLIDKNIILAVLEDQDKAVKKDSDDNVAQQPPSRVESVQQSQISSYRR